MNLERLTGPKAIQLMKEKVKDAILDKSIRVFIIIGPYGNGRHDTIKKAFSELEIDPIEHVYTLIDHSTPIEKEIKRYPDKVHFWKSAFASNINSPKVLAFLQKLAVGEVEFNGTFIMLSDTSEFPDGNYPDFPGVLIEMSNQDILEMIEERIKEGDL